jgi:phosphatidylglycerol lysyltransferase
MSVWCRLNKMKKNLSWLFWLLILVFVYILVSRSAEIETLIDTLVKGKWAWVSVAAVFQFFYFVCYAGIYHSAFSVVDIKSRLRDLIPVMFGSVFMNVAAPLAGSGGSILFVDDARRRNESVGRATTATMLVYLGFLGAFQVFMIPGVIILAFRHQLDLYQILTAVVMYVYIIVLVILISQAIRRPAWLARILGGIRRVVNWIGGLVKKPDYLTEEWISKTTEEITNAALAIASHPGRVVKTFAVGVMAHLAGLLSLYAIFLAFYKPVSLEILVTTYFIILLFTVVSVTPQGIGVVEGAMMLVLGSWGIGYEMSTIITLAYRGLSFWLPLFIGFILLRQLRMFNPKARPYSDSTAIYMVSLFTLFMGLANVVAALRITLPSRLTWFLQFMPLEVQRGGSLTATLAGFGLLVLTYGLLRRKRVAWLAAIILLFLSAISHLLVKLDYSLAFAAILLACWLLYLNPHFHARSDRPSMRLGLITLVVSIIFTVFYGVMGFYLLDTQTGIHFNLRMAVMQTLSMVTEFSSPELVPLTELGRYFAMSIYIIGISTFLYAIIMILRPVLVRHVTNPADRHKAQALVEKYGRAPRSSLALLADKHFFFSCDGHVIAYRVEGRIAIALGDPIGPGASIESAIDEFIIYSMKNDWIPAFYQVYEDSLEWYQSEDYKSARIGWEAILALEDFSGNGKNRKKLHPVQKSMEKAGFHWELVKPPISRKLVDTLAVVNDAWLTHMRATEMSFSAGWFTDEYVSSNPLLVLRDLYNYRVAFANILSDPGDDTIYLDMLRYQPNVHPNIDQFLIVALIEWAQSNQYRFINLGLSTHVTKRGDQPDSLAERGLQYMYEHIESFEKSSHLREFKEKLKPRWKPCYMTFPDYTSLPAVVVALIRADTGDDMIGDLLRL